MIVTGRTDQEHLENLEMAFKCLANNGLKANAEKCKLFKERVTFCGHKIDRHPSECSGQVNIESKTPAAIGSPSIKQQMDAPMERRYPLRERRKPNRLDL